MRWLVAFLTVSLSAQTFEVASVKPAAPYRGGPIHIATAGGPGTDDPTRLTFSNATLAMVMKTAFDLQENQKINGPDWLNIDMFDITATVPAGATKDQMRAMLRNLLAERFHMVWRRETQNARTWVLTAPNGAARLQPSRAIAGAGDAARSDKTLPGVRTISCGNCTMAEFVKMLGHPQGMMVSDETGIAGTWDFELRYEPVYACTNCVAGDGGRGEIAPVASRAAQVQDQAPPVLATAAGEQLGLKLELKQRPVETIAIEKIDRTPTSN